MNKYLVLGSRTWSKSVFSTLSARSGEWRLVESRDELSSHLLEEFTPDLIVVLHWSWLIPEPIVERYETIGFHMTDLPFGRGGSPLQNLIVRGHETTKLSAFKMTAELDAGPIYLKRRLGLKGTAEEIYHRMSRLQVEMIDELLEQRPEPRPQEGLVTQFDRRLPEESELSMVGSSAKALYDFIRMLDAPGYPKAYIDSGDFRLEFDDAMLVSDYEVVARVTIRSAP